jgi:hypothetical protein
METDWHKYFFNFIKKYSDKPWNLDRLGSFKFTKNKEIFELRIQNQKFVQEHIFENIVKAYMHPRRIQKMLNMGYSIDELDNVL